MKILIADDHSLFRESLVRAFQHEPEIEISGEASDFRETVQKARALEPDVVLLDVSMPGRGIVDGIGELLSLRPKPRILLVSGQPEDAHAARCLRLGAAGYVHKTAGLQVLLDAIRRVAAGKRFVSPALAERLIDLPLDGEPHEKLSGREFQVLLLLASGQSASDIGDDLCLSVKTVSTYRRRILDKLNLKNNQEITRYAYQAGLMETPPAGDQG